MMSHSKPKFTTPAPLHLRLEWLIKNLRDSRDVFQRRMESAQAEVDASGEHFEKGKVAAYDEMITSLDWQLASKRPWMKPIEQAPVPVRSEVQMVDPESIRRARGWSAPEPMFEKGSNERNP